MSRFARAAQIVADLVLPAPVDYGRAEPTLPTLEAMANQREAAESNIRRTRWL